MTTPFPAPRGLAAAWLVLLLGAGSLCARAAPDRMEATAQRLLEEAVAKESGGDADAAVRDYQMVVDQFPDTSAAEEALVRRARLLWARGEIFTAEQLLDRLLDSSPRSPHAAAGYVLKARIQAARAENAEELEGALLPLGRVPLLFDRQTHPYLEARAESRFVRAELLRRLGRTAAAGAAYLDILELEAPNRWKAPAALRLAEVLAWRGDWKASAALLQATLDGSYPGEASWIAAAGRRLELVVRMREVAGSGRLPWATARRVSLAVRRASGVAADDAGRLLVADSGAPVLLVVGLDGKVEVRDEAKGVARPWWDEAGAAYFVSPEDIYVPFERAKRSYAERDRKNKLDLLKKIAAGASGAFGDVALLDRGPSRVLRFGAERRFLGEIVSRGEEPVDITADPRGGFLVLFESGQVSRLGPEGDRLGAAASGSFKKPIALATDRLGDLYVLDRGRKRIEVFGPDGRSLFGLGPDLPGGLSLEDPEDLSVDGRGRLFIADEKAGLLVLEGGL